MPAKRKPRLEDDYFPGKGCNCGAYTYGECGCDVDWTPDTERRARIWYKMSDAEMRVRCGELTANEIRTVRAVLRSILRD